MAYELKIALRFLLKGKLQTIFILFGIALGVAVQIFLGNLITSLQDSLVQETIGTSPHIVLTRQADTVTRIINSSEGSILRGNNPNTIKFIDNWKQIESNLLSYNGIKAVSPTQSGTAIIRSSGKSLPVSVKGIELSKADRIYDITPRVISGNATLEAGSVLIGTKLAEELGKAPGDSISFLLPQGVTVQLVISGIFDLENDSTNASLVFIDLARAQKMYGSASSVSSLEIQINDPFSADSVAADLASGNENIEAKNWKDQNRQLLTALTSQSSSSYTIQFFVIIAITFGIASVLAVSAVQKAKQIGILKAMGATKNSIARIFVLEGLLLGLCGAAAGSLGGVLMLNAFSRTGITFSIKVEPANVLLIMFLAVASGVISSLIPARNSARLDPMEAIRNG